MKHRFLCLVLVIMCQPMAQAAGRYDVIVKMVAGGAAVFSAANSAEAATIHKQQDDVLRDLKNRGLDPRDGAIYQIYFQVDPAAAHRWFLKPNVYALVQLEGQGDFIPASITKGYQGQELSLTVFARQVRPGGTILVHILDDKTFWNTAWNSLLQTEIPYNISTAVVTPLVQVQIEASGQFQILNKDITFEPPGYLATARFTVPNPPPSDGIWRMDGTLIDTDKNQVGKLQFSQVWRADPSLLPDIAKTNWRIVFWGGLAVVLAIIFISQFKKQTSKT